MFDPFDLRLRGFAVAAAANRFSARGYGQVPAVEIQRTVVSRRTSNNKTIPNRVGAAAGTMPGGMPPELFQSEVEVVLNVPPLLLSQRISLAIAARGVAATAPAE